MSENIQLVYCSAAKISFSRHQLTQLLNKARKNNAQLRITGILLFIKGSFFQVLEGPKEVVHKLFSHIQNDIRHANITVINESVIAERSFENWTMAFANISQKDIQSILGVKDRFNDSNDFIKIGQDKALKLLEAFKSGSWRAKLSNLSLPMRTIHSPQQNHAVASNDKNPNENDWYSFAFQPIINIESEKIFAFEVLIRTSDNLPAAEVFKQVPEHEIYKFDEESRLKAIKLAGHLGLSSKLNLNFLPGCIEKSPSCIAHILETAQEHHIQPNQIVLEILEKEFIRDSANFVKTITPYRNSGLTFAIDDFGSGYAGLNLLADFQPDYIKLDIHLVKSIHSNGPRQAIVHGILRTCFDLGIDVLAEGVEVVEDYLWLKNQGIKLFQGWLFAKAGFECLPDSFELPKLES